MKKVPAAVPYEPLLLDHLKNIESAAAYLTSCLEDANDDGQILVDALGNVAKAQLKTNALGLPSNPTIHEFRIALNNLNLDIAIVPRDPSPISTT